jgi:tyrosine-protein phosphatase
MVIALVMRAAAERRSSVPPDIWALQGMQAAYDFVKEKSPCVSPNMSYVFHFWRVFPGLTYVSKALYINF